MVAAFYLIRFVIDAHSPTSFLDTQYGIVVSNFAGDPAGRVQTHVAAALQEAVSKENGTSVVIQRVENVIDAQQSAQSVLSTTNARIIIWGTFVPESVVHLRASRPKSSRRLFLSK